MIAGIFGAVAGWAARNAPRVVTGAVLVTLLAGLGVSRLSVDSNVDTLVQRDGPAFTATESVRQSFGEDPVVILIEGDLRRLLSTPNILRILNLEACLAGNVPEDAEPLPGPCGELAELRPAKLVSGPATFLNQAVTGISGEISRQLSGMQAQAQRAGRRAERDAKENGASEEEAAAAGNAAAGKVSQRYLAEALELASRYGLTSIPSLGEPSFTNAVVFGKGKESGQPKARLAYLFPGPESAQIIVRLRPDLTAAERSRALKLFKEAASETKPRKRCAYPKGGDPQPCFALEDGRYVVSGAPVVLDAVAGELTRSLIVLLAVALILMAAILPAVFRSSAPLIPLALALGAAATTFGIYGLLGGRLTIAAIAVLPILIGLAVDYAVQMQARVDEALANPREKGHGGDPESTESGGRQAESLVEAIAGAAREGAPALAAACVATAAGFAVLAFSPTPMVRGFGFILACGVLLSFGFALVVGSASLALRESAEGVRRGRRPRNTAASDPRSDGTESESIVDAARALPAALAAMARSWQRRGAASLAGVGRTLLRLATASPGRFLAVAVLLAALGWVAGTRTETVSELPDLMPPGLQEVRDLTALQEATGVSGELDVAVEAPDLTDPELISWMAGFKRRVLERGGYQLENPSCEEAQLCPGPSLTDFISDAEDGVSRKRVRDLVAALPPYELAGVAEVDEETGELGEKANIAFMIRLMPLQDQQELIEMIRGEVTAGDGPPAGTVVAVGGLPVIAAETATDLSASRYWLTLAALAAIALVLALVMRSPRRVLVTITPIVLATGWSSLMLFAVRVPLNPVSAVLGVMVVAIGTEFSVIISSRYRQERLGGLAPRPALARTYATTGAAVLASGATVIFGFAALIASDIPMLRDFGLVTVVDLSVALAGVIVLLPALLFLSEPRAQRAADG